MFTKSTLKTMVACVACLTFLGFWLVAVNPVAAGDGNLYGCPDDAEFTSEFRIDSCRFKSWGINPYFILLPGYTLVLESEEERSVETVLYDTKWIKLDGRWIETRVLEERAFERDEEDGWVNIEISRNYFAICQKTNAVYYFGEWSRDCEDGFDKNDACLGDETNEGSWEAGVNGAMPGLIMPGTPLNGARYFQEIAPADNAVDRGEILATGQDAGQWSECILVFDTNPAEAADGGCEDGDEKIYCPRVGLVQDEDLELIWYGFAGRHGRHHGDHRDKKWRWKWR